MGCSILLEGGLVLEGVCNLHWIWMRSSLGEGARCVFSLMFYPVDSVVLRDKTTEEVVWGG